LPELSEAAVIRLTRNAGKGTALRVGFQRAAELGFTHAITMDADGQHFAEDLPKFLAAAERQPDALVVGIRDFRAAGCPTHRRRSNAVSTFWFRVETGVRLPDTQCGFRCYPLALTQQLQAKSQRYAFELEFMVRASWVGTPLVPVPVTSSYRPEQLRESHFRPVVDLARITLMNIGLVLQSWFVPRAMRTAWSFGRRCTFKQSVRELFGENAQQPGKIAFAVGIGLFCGIAPIWGYQMIAAAALAHLLRLNKAIALVASNISIPPVMPFILYGALVLGHWLFTGHRLQLSARSLTRNYVLQYLVEWCVGSVVLAALVATLGILTTYGVARVVQKR
jgi:uncharacterized protein (DUF2062 family)